MNTTNPNPVSRPPEASTAVVLFQPKQVCRFRCDAGAQENPRSVTRGLNTRKLNKNKNINPSGEGDSADSDPQTGWRPESPSPTSTYVDFYRPENALGEFRDLFDYDWLQGSCTIMDAEQVAFGWIQNDLGLLPQLDNKAGANGFAVKQNFVEDYGEKSCEFAIQALCEHQDRLDDVHLMVTGGRHELCQDLMGFIKKHSGGVSRVDVAADFLADYENIVLVAWNALPRTMRRAGQRPEMIIGKDGGRTVYLGSKQSDYYCRIYEKGIQLITLGLKADPRMVRVEFQYRPQSRWKHAVAGMPARDIAICKNWSSHVVAKIAAYLGANGGVHRVQIVPRERTKTVTETLVFSVDQYRRHAQQVGLDLVTSGDKELEKLKQEIIGFHKNGMLDEAEVAFVKFNALVYHKMNMLWVEEKRVDWVDQCTGEFNSYNPRVSEFVKRAEDHDGRRDPKATAARMKRDADRRKQNKASAEARRAAFTARLYARYKLPLLTDG